MVKNVDVAGDNLMEKTNKAMEKITGASWVIDSGRILSLYLYDYQSVRIWGAPRLMATIFR